MTGTLLRVVSALTALVTALLAAAAPARVEITVTPPPAVSVPAYELGAPPVLERPAAYPGPAAGYPIPADPTATPVTLPAPEPFRCYQPRPIPCGVNNGDHH